MDTLINFCTNPTTENFNMINQENQNLLSYIANWCIQNTKGNIALARIITKLSKLKTINRRPPISHQRSWENEKDDSPTEKANKAKINQINDLQDYDIIINEQEPSYKNNGVYI